MIGLSQQTPKTKLESEYVEIEALDYAILEMFDRLSTCIVIFGTRGSGKTNFSLKIAETLERYQEIPLHATNIKIVKSPFSIERIVDLETLEYWGKLSKERKLFIFDEAGKSVRKRTPMSGMNVRMLDNLQIMRKYQMSIIIITPDERYIDSTFLGEDLLDYIVEKPYWDNQKIGDIYNCRTRTRERFFDIPSTSIQFDTNDIATFTQYAPKKRLLYKDADKQFLWDWTHGLLPSPLPDCQRKRLERVRRNFIKNILEQERDA